jgi:hypothetical protein
VAKYMDGSWTFENVVINLTLSLRGENFFISSVIVITSRIMSALYYGVRRWEVLGERTNMVIGYITGNKEVAERLGFVYCKNIGYILE